MLYKITVTTPKETPKEGSKITSKSASEVHFIYLPHDTPTYTISSEGVTQAVTPEEFLRTKVSKGFVVKADVDVVEIG